MAMLRAALYCRLSKDDMLQGDSESIKTQKAMLTQYTKEHGFLVVEIYVDDVLVGRVDNIVRDENVRPINVSVNGGKVLMIKAINTDSASGSICYVSDTNLTVLQ